jgi:hypothetical protein
VVSEYLANYARVREILEDISQINHELLRRRQPLRGTAVSQPSASLAAHVDIRDGTTLLANMLIALVDNDSALVTMETTDEHPDHRSTPEHAGVHLCAP